MEIPSYSPISKPALAKPVDMKKQGLIRLIYKVCLETIKRIAAIFMGLIGLSLGCLFGIPSAIYVTLVLELQVIKEVLKYLGNFIANSVLDLYHPTYEALNGLIN